MIVKYCIVIITFACICLVDEVPLRSGQPVVDRYCLCVVAFAFDLFGYCGFSLRWLRCAMQYVQYSTAIRKREENGALHHSKGTCH